MGRFTITADRYVYVSAIAVFFFISYWFVKGALTFHRFSWLLRVAGIAYLLLLAGYTHLRIDVWYDTDTLKGDIRKIIELNVR